LRPVQGFHLGGREPEHEILREACDVTLDLFVEPLGGHAVQPGQVRIDHYLLPTNERDPALDALGGHQRRVLLRHVSALRLVSAVGLFLIVSRRYFVAHI